MKSHLIGFSSFTDDRIIPFDIEIGRAMRAGAHKVELPDGPSGAVADPRPTTELIGNAVNGDTSVGFGPGSPLGGQRPVRTPQVEKTHAHL